MRHPEAEPEPRYEEHPEPQDVGDDTPSHVQEVVGTGGVDANPAPERVLRTFISAPTGVIEREAAPCLGVHPIHAFRKNRCSRLCFRKEKFENWSSPLTPPLFVCFISGRKGATQEG